MKTAIIVLSWGKAHLTSKCFKTLSQYTDLDSFHLYWVQNESGLEAEAMEGIRQSLSAQSVSYTVIANEENLGFTAGVNAALREVMESDFDYVCLLNNDTKVTPQWLTNLINSLGDDYGAIGPLTDNGGFQRVEHMAGQHPDTVWPIREGETYMGYAERVTANEHPTISVPEIAFFCTVMPMAVVRQAGLLNESKELETFGSDNDYCYTLSSLGYKIGVAPNVMIHHDHGATVNLNPTDRTEASQEARDFLNEKWNNK